MRHTAAQEQCAWGCSRSDTARCSWVRVLRGEDAQQPAGRCLCCLPAPPLPRVWLRSPRPELSMEEAQRGAVHSGEAVAERPCRVPWASLASEDSVPQTAGPARIFRPLDTPLCLHGTLLPT